MKLLFIYNANSGKLNSLFDAGHKLISSSTYKCALCNLTHNTFLENKVWKNFRKEREVAMEFYHKDEFQIKYGNVNLVYPVILKFENELFSVVLSAEDLNNMPRVEALITQLRKKM